MYIDRSTSKYPSQAHGCINDTCTKRITCFSRVFPPSRGNPVHFNLEVLFDCGANLGLWMGVTSTSWETSIQAELQDAISPRARLLQRKVPGRSTIPWHRSSKSVFFFILISGFLSLIPRPRVAALCFAPSEVTRWNDPAPISAKDCLQIEDTLLNIAD